MTMTVCPQHNRWTHITNADGTTADRDCPECENTGITPKGLALGHRYVQGNVNAYCPKCSEEHSREQGRPITVLDCDHDPNK